MPRTARLDDDGEEEDGAAAAAEDDDNNRDIIILRHRYEDDFFLNMATENITLKIIKFRKLKAILEIYLQWYFC